MKNSDNSFEDSTELPYKYNRTGVLDYMWEISLENQNKQEKYLTAAKSLEVDDVDLQSEEFYHLRDKQQKAGYIAIVFAAIYIEGSIYNYGCIHLGDDYVKKNLQHLNTLSKISVILRLVTGRDIDSSSQAYEHISRLIKYRNSIVHTKTKSANVNKQYFLDKEREATRYIRAIESAKYAVKFLENETREYTSDKYNSGIFSF